MPEQVLINERLSHLDPGYRDYISSGEPSIIVSSLAEIHNLDEVSTLALENGFLLFLLYFLSKNDFTMFIVEECQLSPEQAVILVNAFLLALPSDVRLAYEKTASESTISANSKLIGEIQETEALLNTMPSLRTTNTVTPDMVYTSTQSAILQDSLHNQTK